MVQKVYEVMTSKYDLRPDHRIQSRYFQYLKSHSMHLNLGRVSFVRKEEEENMFKIDKFRKRTVKSAFDSKAMVDQVKMKL